MTIKLATYVFKTLDVAFSRMFGMIGQNPETKNAKILRGRVDYFRVARKSAEDKDSAARRAHLL
jgi:hypothetical protein